MKYLKPLVSVIITTKNEAVIIDKLMKSIFDQSYKNFEIILVDNNSQDQTKKKAKKMGAKVYNFGPERSAQRNFGAKKSRGFYFLFLDADMSLSVNVIKQCVEIAQSDKTIGGVVIPERSKASNFLGKIKSYERSFYNERGDFITDAARFFTREAFCKAKGYDETITGPEDWDLSETIKNTGYKIKRISAYIYHHERITSILVLVKKKFYYALLSSRYLDKHKISIIGPKTVYFLRPIFYKNWKKLLKNPSLTTGLFLMLFFEQIGGIVGYLYGRITKQ